MTKAETPAVPVLVCSAGRQSDNLRERIFRNMKRASHVRTGMKKSQMVMRGSCIEMKKSLLKKYTKYQREREKHQQAAKCEREEREVVDINITTRCMGIRGEKEVHIRYYRIVGLADWGLTALWWIIHTSGRNRLWPVG